MANLTKVEALSIGLTYLRKKGKDFSESDVYINYKADERIRDGSIKNIWVLGYSILFLSETRDLFLVISDDDGEILYGVHDTGYFEIKE